MSEDVTTIPADPSRPAKRRVDSIDVARGAAIVLLFFNHGVVLLDENLPAWVHDVVYRVSDVCIPMFMGISGVTMAYLLRRSRRDPRVVARRYARRAVGLLVATHVMITLGIWPLYAEEHGFVELLLFRWHITDAIAFCLLVGPTLILRMSDAARLILGVLLPIGCRAVTAFWHPDATFVAAGKELLFGIDDYDASPALLNAYALGPYFAMFLLGTVLATPMLNAVENKTVPHFLRRCMMACVGLIALGVGLSAVYVGVLKRWLDPTVHSDWLGLCYPSKITLLLPIYLAFGGLMIALIVWWVEHRRVYGRFAFMLTVFGRTSLFSYVAQYFLIQGLPSYLGWIESVSLPVFFPLMVAFTLIMYAAAYLYARADRAIAPGEFATIRDRVVQAESARRDAHSSESGIPATQP